MGVEKIKIEGRSQIRKYCSYSKYTKHDGRRQSMGKETKQEGRRQFSKYCYFLPKIFFPILMPIKIFYLHSTGAFFPLSLQSCSVTTASYILHIVTVYQASSILLLNSTFYPKFLYPPSAFLLLYLLFSSFSFSSSPASCPVLFHACLLFPFCSSPSLNVHSLRTLMFNTALSFSYFTSSFLLLFFYPAPIPFGCPLRSSLGTSEERGA